MPIVSLTRHGVATIVDGRVRFHRGPDARRRAQLPTPPHRPRHRVRGRRARAGARRRCCRCRVMSPPRRRTRATCSSPRGSSTRTPTTRRARRPSVMHMLNTIAYRGTGGYGFRWKPYTVKKSSNPDQLRDMTSILAFERRNDTLRSSTSGSDAHGWRNALNYYGWGSSAMTNASIRPYEDRAYSTYRSAMKAAVRAIARARHARRRARLGGRPCAGDHGLRGHRRGPEDVVRLHDPVAVPVRPAQVERDRQPQDELRGDEGRGAQVALPVVPRDRQPVRRPVHERLDPQLREADHGAVRVVPQVGPGAPRPPWPAAAGTRADPDTDARRPTGSPAQQPAVAPRAPSRHGSDGTASPSASASGVRRRRRPSPSASAGASPSPTAAPSPSAIAIAQPRHRPRVPAPTRRRHRRRADRAAHAHAVAQRRVRRRRPRARPPRPDAARPRRDRPSRSPRAAAGPRSRAPARAPRAATRGSRRTSRRARGSRRRAVARPPPRSSPGRRPSRPRSARRARTRARPTVRPSRSQRGGAARLRGRLDELQPRVRRVVGREHPGRAHLAALADRERYAGDRLEHLARQAARPQDRRLLARQVDDRRLDAHRGRAAVEHEVDPVTEALADVRGGRGRDRPEPVGRRRRDPAAERPQQRRARPGAPGPAARPSAGRR